MATPLASEPVAKPLEIRAVLRYGRFSSYKAREVLDLIRGKSVAEARAILAFTERGCAVPILKLLESAVANAGNNHDLPPEELFVSACFADEGPTLRRYRPRARGRGARIRKRTCHITIVLGRYTGEELARMRERAAARRAAPADARAARARRVAGSRRSGEAARATETTEDAASGSSASGDAEDTATEVPALEEAEAADASGTGTEVADDAPTAGTESDGAGDTGSETAGDTEIEAAAGDTTDAEAHGAGDTAGDGDDDTEGTA
jgi:large subunit ribosomal protein L22